MNILLTCDGYKTCHQKLVPENTTLTYGNWTPRSLKHAPNGTTHIVSFGQQYVLKWLNEQFDEFFANESYVDEAQKFLTKYIGTEYDATHFQELWDLQYLPMCFKSLPEGARVPPQVPIMTWYNTDPRFSWLPLYLETIISNQLWKPMTSATIVDQFRKNCLKAVKETDAENIHLVDFMLHDFSARGMGSLGTTISSGMGFLTGSKGSDSIAAINACRKYYKEDMAGFSVNASEHSVSSTCMAVMSEQEMIEFYMKQCPTGSLSIVSDTFDLTKVVKPGGYLDNLKGKILSRDGKIVIRPDSNPEGLTPADIICGHDNKLSDRELEADYPEFYTKGLIQCLWEIFGGDESSEGFKRLDPHIGAIYGEAVSIELQKAVYERLKKKGFASTNICLGVGSYTLNMNSRDTLGFAAKGTYAEFTTNGEVEGIDIFKDPVTSSGFKKSAKGKMRVDIVDGEYTMTDEATWEQEAGGALTPVFRDSILLKETTLKEIRERLNNGNN